MMGSFLKHEEDKRIKCTTIKDIRNFFKLNNQSKKKNFVKNQLRGSFHNKNYTEYENNGKRNKAPSIEEYFI